VLDELVEVAGHGPFGAVVPDERSAGQAIVGDRAASVREVGRPDQDVALPGQELLQLETGRLTTGGQALEVVVVLLGAVAVGTPALVPAAEEGGRPCGGCRRST